MALCAYALAVVALAVALVACGVCAVDSVADRSALVDVYQSMGGAQWTTQTNWLSPTVSMCSWHGVTCAAGCNNSNVDCRVTKLILAANKLQGAISPALLQLTELTWLALDGNALSGTLLEFETLTQLTILKLHDNQLTGTISDLSALVQLQQLRLDGNRLTGSVREFQTLTQLLQLFLNKNQLSGTIGDFSTLSSLQVLALNDNALTGSLPEFQALGALRILFAANNRFSGQTPEFAALTQLQVLSLSSNQLSGTLPEFQSLTLLLQLRVDYNALTGAAPALATLTALQVLALSENQLSGSLPLLAANTQLREVWLNNNRFSGSVSEYASLVQLEVLRLDSNNLTGQAPQFSTLGALKQLSLYANRLHGTFPEYAALTQLQQLNVAANLFSGAVPSLATLTQLRSLYANSMLLNGTLPSFATLTQLQTLSLFSNYISGTISSLASLTQLRTLYLHKNRLVGTIGDLTSLAQLQELRLDANSLSGRLPEFNLAALRRLDVSDNALSGPLPLCSGMPQLAQLRAARNQFTGSLPVAWRALRALALVDVAENALSGAIRVFQAADAQLLSPPLSAGFVNLSFNRFGGSSVDLLPSASADALNLTALDVRYNAFTCPYALLPLSVRLLRTACTNDWAQLGVYAGIAAGALVVSVAALLVVKRLVAEQRVRAAQFALAWCVAAVGVVSDAFSYAAMVQYLQTRSTQTCDSMNAVRVFLPQLVDVGAYPPALQGVAGSSSFAAFVAPPVWIAAFSNGLDARGDYIAAFASACAQAPECAYDAVNARCYEAYADRATSGGGAHQPFLVALLALIAVRCAYEALCLGAIVVSCARNELVLSCRVWMRGSVFMPALAVREGTRAALVSDVVLADTPPHEYLLELATRGVFVLGAKLGAQLYYLIVVAQTGLGLFNWLSLAVGVVTVPRLIVQAALASCRQQPQSPAIDETPPAVPTRTANGATTHHAGVWKDNVLRASAIEIQPIGSAAATPAMRSSGAYDASGGAVALTLVRNSLFVSDDAAALASASVPASPPPAGAAMLRRPPPLSIGRLPSMTAPAATTAVAASAAPHTPATRQLASTPPPPPRAAAVAGTVSPVVPSSANSPTVPQRPPPMSRRLTSVSSPVPMLAPAPVAALVSRAPVHSTPTSAVPSAIAVDSAAAVGMHRPPPPSRARSTAPSSSNARAQ